MAINNSLNTNGVPLSILTNGGSLGIATDATANVTTIGNITGTTAVNINTGTGGNTITTTNGVHTVVTGTGAINLGTDAAAKTITVGNVTGATAVNINTGTGGSIVTTTNGIFSLRTGTGAITIGTDTGNRTITMGYTNNTSLTSIQGGVGGINLTALAGPVNITTGGNIFSLLTAAGDIRIGTDATTKYVKVGSTVSNGAIQLFGGPGGIQIGYTAGINVPIVIGPISSPGSSYIIMRAGTSGITNAITNGVFTVTTGTGAISIGADAVAKTITIGNTTGATSFTLDTGSGGINIPSFTTTGALVSTAAGLITDADASTAGFVLTSNGASTAPSFQAASGGGFVWNNVTGTTQSAAINNGYIANNAGLVTVTLPSTAAVGSVVSIQGATTGLWTLAQNASQTVAFNGVTSTSGVGGSVSATSQFDSISVICITANNAWAVNTSSGTLNVV